RLFATASERQAGGAAPPTREEGRAARGPRHSDQFRSRDLIAPGAFGRRSAGASSPASSPPRSGGLGRVLPRKSADTRERTVSAPALSVFEVPAGMKSRQETSAWDRMSSQPLIFSRTSPS